MTLLPPSSNPACSAELLRVRIRTDRERRYTSFLAAVRRMQAVFRRRQLLKARQEGECRAAAVVQDWGRNFLAVMAAKRELQRRVGGSGGGRGWELKRRDLSVIFLEHACPLALLRRRN